MPRCPDKPVQRHRLPDSASRNLGLGGFRVFLEELDQRHQDPRGAETALQAVIVLECLLQGAQRLAVEREPFDRFHAGAMGLYGQHQTASYRAPVHQHRARPAHAVLAAEVRAGQAETGTQAIREGHA